VGGRGARSLVPQMDRDQPGLLRGWGSPSFAGVLLAGVLVVGAATGVGAQVPEPTTSTTAATTTSATTTSATTTSATTTSAAATTVTAAAPPAPRSAPGEEREQGNVWIVVAATIAMIAALVAIAVLQRRRDPATPASAPRAGGEPPAPSGTAKPRAGAAAKPKPKPGGAARPGSSRSTKPKRRAPAKRKPRKR
jgi:cytoskeletal protein RodZ